MGVSPNVGRRFSLSMCGFLAWLVLAVPFGFAVSPVGDPFPIKGVAGINNLPTAVVFNPTHEEFLVLYRNIWSADTSDIYAQRIAYDGTLLSWFAVVSGPNEDFDHACAAFSTAHDEYLIVWTARDTSNPPPSIPNDGVHGRRVSWDGSWMGPVITIADDVDRQHEPAVAYNAVDDEYLVVYGNTWASNVNDIAAQRIAAADGSLLSWANIATGTSPHRWTPNLAHDPGSNRYLITYLADQDSIRSKLAAADLSGVSVAPETTLFSDQSVAISNKPGVALGPGEFAVAWYQNEGATNTTRLRRVSLAGTPQGPADGLHLILSDLGHWAANERVEVVIGPEGEYFVISEPDMVGLDSNIAARLVLPGVDATHGPRLDIVASPVAEFFPVVACAPFGDCLVVYAGMDASLHGNVIGQFVRIHIFADGFELGDMGAWTRPSP